MKRRFHDEESASDSASYGAAGSLWLGSCSGGKSHTGTSLLPKPLLCEVIPNSHQKERFNMKKVIRILVVTLLLAVWGSIPVLASGPWPVPICYPNPCSVK
jgi:hypothetical protein